MSAHDPLVAVFQSANSPPADWHSLSRTVAREARRRRLTFRAEVASTIALFATLAYTIAVQGMRPVHWLVLPFVLFVLPLHWRARMQVAQLRFVDVDQSSYRFGNRRRLQIAQRIRDLRADLVRAVAMAVYAALAAVVCYVVGDPRWLRAAILFFGIALIWAVVVRAYATSRTRRLHDEMATLLELDPGSDPFAPRPDFNE